MEQLIAICTCDDNCDDPCLMHARENELQDKVIELEQELKFSREREEDIDRRAKILLARKKEEIKQLRKSEITIAKLRNYLNGDLPNDCDYYLDGTVFVDDVEEILDEADVKFVKAGPVVVKKVEGDVGYTILMLVEDDEWDYWPYAENYSLLVPLKAKS